ncbi:MULTISPECIES: hypothetical protein [unclassified Acidovorax]|uniref:hypothetical protein n=1 Tax=unclassified Acidovorax TaxID=2684926 RepID=UPI001C444962|nr:MULTISPECIES: hypothetical protein [unclassified Acidovorax]MBV7428022.1 hypothetical protein [Acidovorax sp. sif0732]MBV7449279.1 hypothetical protein [Acidovorax sp. sif0715]
MNELTGVCAALASLTALTTWARAVPARAWGDGAAAAPTSLRSWAVALGTLALQALAATAAAGLAAGLALVVAAWMVLGWLLVLAMNQWPAASLRWSRRLGALGATGCGLALTWQLLRAWGAAP